jgi:hypothetical protein
MDMDVALGEGILADVQAQRVGPGVGERRAGRLLHDVAQLPRQEQVALAPHDRSLDEHDVAAHGGVIHAGGDADPVLPGSVFRMDFRPAQQFVHHFPRHFNPLDFPRRDLPGHLAAELPDLTLQLAHPGFTGVAGDRLADRVVGERDLLVRQTVLAPLAGNEVVPRDHELFPFGVPAELDDLHAVEQRPGDVLHEVRGADEQHFTQIERDAKVVIDETVVLRRVEHLEQRARGIALKGDPELVYLVQQEDRIACAGLLHPLENSSRHGADVGTAVTANVRLVTCAAKRDADVLPPHGTGDGPGNGSLADARRPREQENRAFRRLLTPRGLGWERYRGLFPGRHIYRLVRRGGG